MNPRWYQTAANNAAWHYLSNNPGNPLIVLPTGAGKSLVIAMLCQQAREFGGRVVVLQHRKELIQQNAEKIQVLLPEIKVGLYSAGLKARQTDCDVMCAGIQSIYRKAGDIGDRHLIVIDEAHLVSSNDETMYGQFLSEIRLRNPKSRVAGLTATPFRTGEGPICGREKLFQRICFEAQTKQLIDEGFLCPITNRPADAEVDTSGLKLRGGEFIESDMQSVFDVADTVAVACSEIVAKCEGRHSVLVFSSGVAHADHIAETLRKLTGENVGVVTGETFPMERAAMLSAFKGGSLRWLVNCDVLTTGFDAPCIDAICVLRATMSPGLFAQMVGRGLRNDESKTDCLILDFGGNIKRHGSLDDPQYGRASVGGKASAAENNGRGKLCPNCGLDVAARLSECLDCGFIFPTRDPRHEHTADSESQLTGATPPEEWIVSAVSWQKHTKRHEPDAPPTLRINYDCSKDGEGGLIKTQISEWVCFSHPPGFALQKARQWWLVRSDAPMPESVDEALSLLNRGAARMSSHITTKKNGKFYQISACSFTDEKPDEWEPEREAVIFDGFDEVPF